MRRVGEEPAEHVADGGGGSDRIEIQNPFVKFGDAGSGEKLRVGAEAEPHVRVVEDHGKLAHQTLLVLAAGVDGDGGDVVRKGKRIVGDKRVGGRVIVLQRDAPQEQLVHHPLRR